MADSGAVMTDEMGNVTTGTHSGASLATAPIPTAAGAHLYDGASDSSYDQIADLSTSSYTTLLWAVLDDTATGYMKLYSGGLGVWPFDTGHGLETDGSQFLHTIGLGGEANTNQGMGAVSKGVPIRFALVNDNGTIRSYRNGVQVAGPNALSYVPASVSTELQFGARDSGLYFKGLIWDVVLFDRALTPSEVAEDYEKGASFVTIETTDEPNTIVQGAPAGSTFWFEPGVHRMTTAITPREGDSFHGGAGAVLSGAKVLSSWAVDGDTWKATGQTQQGSVTAHSCAVGYPLCNRPEELFIDDVRMLHVASIGAVTTGTWHFDYDNDTIYIGDDPSGKTVETSFVNHAIWGNADNVTVKNLTVEKFANAAQTGAIWSERSGGDGGNWLVEGCTVRLNHGVGIRVGYGAVVKGNTVTRNGQMGVASVGGTGTLFEDNEISYNNEAGYDYGWEGGGSKFVGTDGLILRGNFVHHNYGPGLWCDIDNINTLYEDNIVEDNAHNGIFHEISYDAIIRNNVVNRNGLDVGTSSYGWVYGAGIFVSNSPNVEVYGNTVEGNLNGITAVNQNRGTGAYGAYELKNLYVHDNTVHMQWNPDHYNYDSPPLGYRSKSGVARDTDYDPFEPEANNVFENNDYIVDADTSASWFAWANGERNWTQWTTTYGQDAGGSITLDD